MAPGLWNSFKKRLKPLRGNRGVCNLSILDRKNKLENIGGLSTMAPVVFHSCLYLGDPVDQGLLTSRQDIYFQANQSLALSCAYIQARTLV